MEGTEFNRRIRQYSNRSRRIFLQSVGAAGLGLATSTTAIASASENPTEINSCTIIDEPGEYELVADITPDVIDQPGCIVIDADDVHLDGNGHTIDVSNAEFDSSGFDPFGFYTRPRVIAVNPFAFEGELTFIDGGTIEDVELLGGAAGIEYTFAGQSHVSGVRAAENGSGITVRFEGLSQIEDSTLEDNSSGLELRGDPDVFGGSGVSVDHCTVRENRNVGVVVGHEMTVEITNSEILDNAIGVSETPLGAQSTLRNTNICRNDHYGVLNVDAPEDEEFPEFSNVTDAIENYWGASNGPSSFGDPAAPFTDPETGRPADGDGDAISQSLEPGVSNVRFDPFLEAPNPDAGVRQ